MKKEENKVDFDLSNLKLEELLKVYENITDFLQYLDETKIVQIEDNNDDE